MVSVIIPTYNRGEVIKHSIDSVLEQTYGDLELLIVDDASTDNTKQIVEEYRNTKIRYIRSEIRVGANGARNIGIRNAKGEYVAFQDSDDVWEADKLEKQIAFLEDNRDTDIVYSRYHHYLLNGEVKLVPNSNYTKQELEQEISGTLANGNVIGTPTMVVRKKCFDEEGLFDESIPRFQDWELSIRFAKKYKFGVIEEALVRAYESEKSISKAKGSGLEAMLLIINKHREFFEEKGTLLRHAGNLINIALSEKKIAEVFHAMDEELFLQGLYRNEIQKDATKKNSEFIKDWMKKGSKEIAVNDFFQKYADKSIALYGMGELGKLLADVLTEENKKKIKFVIERNRSIVSKFEMRTLDDLDTEELEKVECIVITAITHEKEIRKNLKNLAVTDIVALSDII